MKHRTKPALRAALWKLRRHLQHKDKHPWAFDPHCETCIRKVMARNGIAEITTERRMKGDPTMKSAWLSKSVWLAIATMALGVIQQLQLLPLDAKTLGILTTLAGALAFVVRLLTDQPVTIGAAIKSVFRRK